MPQPLRIALLLFVALGTIGILSALFWRALRRSNEPAWLIFKWVLTVIVVGWVAYEAYRERGAGAEGKLVVLFFAALPAAVVMTIVWGRSIGEAVAAPFSNMFTGGTEEPDPVPLYSIAEALRRRGKYQESLYAIQEQLEKFPTDFTGQMMLAEIQAESLKDLQAAEVTIHRLCEQKQSPANRAFALNSLADWHLKITQDADAAKRALEKISELLPATEFERTAANRIAHLADSATLVKLHEPEVVAMKPGVEYLGLLKDQSHLLPKEKSAADEAAELVAHLEIHPLDHEARERLAVLYAESYGRLDLATEQLEQLMGLPGESPKHVVRWLNLLANLQIQTTGTTELAEQTLRRIIDLFPNHSFAQMAEERIATLRLELKRYEKSRVVKLGSKEESA